MAEHKKTLTVKLRVQELVFDIQNKAYLTGQSREADGAKGYEAASNMQVNDDNENSYQIRRSLDNAFAELKSLLGEYLVESTGQCAPCCDAASTRETDNLIDDEIDNDGMLKMVFSMPSNFNDSSSDTLGSGIHAYLVDRALGDWFTITNREDADTYVAHSAVILETVKRALYKRSRPERPTY